MLTFLTQLFKQLMPEKNVICAYVGGAACAGIVHLLVAANVQLDATQAASLAAAGTGLVAHIWDSIAKTIEVRAEEKATTSNLPVPPVPQTPPTV